MRIHRILLYLWWLLLLLSLQILSQGGTYQHLIQTWALPALGVVVITHAIWLTWIFLQRVYSGSVFLFLIVSSLTVWELTGGLVKAIPWESDLSLWIQGGWWIGYLLWVGGVLFYFFSQGVVMALVGVLFFLVGWIFQITLFPTWSLIPLLTLGLGVSLFSFGGTFFRTWTLWLMGLLSLWLFTFKGTLLHPAIIPLMPFLSGMILATGAYLELRYDPRTF